MPLELRHSPRRSFQRMYRRILQPHRLVNFNERMNRYRPILPSLQEDDAMDQRLNADLLERRSKYIKRRMIRHGMHHGHLNQTAELQIIPSEEWARNPESFENWPAEPHIIITSDEHQQTDDSVHVYDMSSPSGSSGSTSGIQPPSLFTHSFNDTGMMPPSTITSDSETDGNLEGQAPEPLETNYFSQDEPSTMPSVADRAVQVPSIHDEDSSHSNFDGVETIEEVKNKSRQSDFSMFLPNRMYTRTVALPNLPSASHEAKRVANQIIRHARNNKTLDENEIHCLNCDLFPIQPVTGPCGHTRCSRCIQHNGACPCGEGAPQNLHVNTAVQHLIAKMLPSDVTRRGVLSGVTRRSSEVYEDTEDIPSMRSGRSSLERRVQQTRLLQETLRSPLSLRIRALLPELSERMPMPPQVQFEHARRLLTAGRYHLAAPHLARVAASSSPLARNARVLLSQIIQAMCGARDLRRITRTLFRAVRLQAATSWLKASDLECVLCYHTYINPVTTPCGHTYCRTCLERALDYRKVCALCLRPLQDFDLSMTRETKFVRAALNSIDAVNRPLPFESDVIPIFVCTVAYPSIPCPLFIFDPRYWLMIRRVLESGSRKFGMVAYERDRSYSDFGTVLEVRDCVQLEDGRSFLSTVGISRFRIIERDVRDGCDVARIQPLVDITPTEEDPMLDLRLLGSQILYKALVWLNGMNSKVRDEIETAFGQIPRFDRMQNELWDSADGPAWLWWLIAILPLRSEIKVLILSTKNLTKRLMAVSRTLEAIDQVAITTTATSECEIRSALTNAEEWLERGS